MTHQSLSLALSFVLALWSIAALYHPLRGQVAANPAGGQLTTNPPSVSELVNLLQSIDPYRAATEVKGTVRVAGSTSMDALAHIWASGFNEFHKAVKVEISAAESEETFKMLMEKPSSIAMLSRPVREEELAELKKKGLKDPVAFVVAKEALAVFVHKTNPVQYITGEQLRAVFTTSDGEAVPTWAKLGATGDWASKPIHVISRTEKSGTQIYLRDYVFGGSTLRPGISAFSSNSEVLHAMDADPLAIAICGLKSSGSSVRSLALVVGNTTIPSDDNSVLSGRYPITRAMSVVIDMGQSDADAKAAQEYVHFALCQAGQAATISATLFPVDLPLLRAGLNKLQGAQFR